MLTSSIFQPRRNLLVLTLCGILSLAGVSIAQEVAPKPATQTPAANSDSSAEDAELVKKTDTPVAEQPVSMDSKDVPESKNSDGEEKSPEKVPEKKGPKKSLPQILQDQLLDQAKAQVENPVESILERMRTVQDRLTKTATDKETRKEQAQIVSEIDLLIDALKNLKPPPPQSSDSNQDQPPPPMGGQPDPDQQAQGTPQPRPQNSKKQEGEKAPQTEKEKQQGKKQTEQPGQTESVSDKARDSNNSTAKRPRSAEEEAARQRLAKDVWGHLPPGLRQELLNIFSEKYIPKYDEQVRRYYEALAEQNRGEQ